MFTFKPRHIQVCTLAEAMSMCRNQTALAKELGISRSTLRSHLECGGKQLLEVVEKGADEFGFTYINKGWTK